MRVTARTCSIQNITQCPKLAGDNKDVFKHCLNLETNKTISLGTINGKPFDMKIFEGGASWTGSQMIRMHPQDARVTDEEMAAAAAFEAYTPDERLTGNSISALINQLYLVAHQGLGVSTFNNWVETQNKSQDEIKEALQRLGIDSNQTFTINGRSFSLDSGELADAAAKP